ncbi:MAG: response regulator [Actinomycetota bacterium]
MQASDRLAQARVLIVDDEESNLRLLERLLDRAGYGNVVGTTDSRQVAPLFGEFAPDLVILDLIMPHMDGFEVMEALSKEVPDGAYLPILVLTADASAESKRRALSMGARDFLTKPFDHDEALLRIRNLLETRSLYLRLQAQNEALEEKVRERTSELQENLNNAQNLAEHRRELLALMASARLGAAADE